MLVNRGLRHQIERMLASTDVAINGDRPWDIRIKDRRFFPRVIAQGSFGFGESYMDGWWDTESLDQLLYRLIRARLQDKLPSVVTLTTSFKHRLLNCQSLRRAFTVGEKHYDIGNDLYRDMLDSRMIYSCGYWRNARTLDEAQVAKLDLICRKLQLQAGQKVLDIGCGWGGCARYLAEHYGVEVVGITISKAQADLAVENCRGLPIDIRVQDYREIEGTFDRVVSIGMFEHVGYKNYRTYFRKVAELLKEDGLFLLHTIGANKSTRHTDPWFDHYIFPNGMIPSARQISAGFEGLFVLEDWHNFGVDYDKTLMAWYANFTAAWPRLRHHYDERFRRMWTYYLLSCAASFRARHNQLWQVALSPRGLAETCYFPR
ncbi:MAG: cyclopropane fatty acyl phospholipid synthase [Pelovirga sp.]